MQPIDNLRSIVEKVISGGQTGVDRSGLNAALTVGIERGGWCPRGRRAEDGPIPMHYPLIETASSRFEVRTELNIRDSGATLITVETLPLTGGTLRTELIALKMPRPCKVAVLGETTVDEVLEWLKTTIGARAEKRVLNIAGPRESKFPGIGQKAESFLVDVLTSTQRRR